MWPCTFHAPKQLFTETCRLKRVFWWTDVGSKIPQKAKVYVFQLGTSFISRSKGLSGRNSGAWNCETVIQYLTDVTFFIVLFAYITSTLFIIVYFINCSVFVSFRAAHSIIFFFCIFHRRTSEQYVDLTESGDASYTCIFVIFCCVIFSSSYLPRLDF